MQRFILKRRQVVFPSNFSVQVQSFSKNGSVFGFSEKYYVCGFQFSSGPASNEQFLLSPTVWVRISSGSEF